ncbi:hypothetical protein GY631_3034 [Trichophyton interdigitale]|uniref:DUF2415 domain-containing protein n=1 Tax=Trichophyton interdigitale TaxID=101480 RepID=A0A9P5CVF6_9EURO|nr:hypothetical protein GY631_3034 [Trichophyton interdigitale]KAF3896621.1 hypothetical protein GY632_2690 [Trichophyton interdigitale]
MFPWLNCQWVVFLMVDLVSAFRPISSKRPWKYDERVDDGIIELNHCDWVGSVAINTDRYALVVSQGLLSGKGTDFAVCKLIEPDEIYGRSSRSVFQNYSVFKRKNASFCSAVAYPGAHSCSFIIGHGNELMVVSSAHGMHSMGRFNVYPADIMAVDWISNSEVIVGLRNSAVALTDWRCAASTTRLVHSHGVKKLKMVGDSKVLVAGFDNTLDMYDLRFTRAAVQRHLDPNSRNHRSSTPYLRFGEVNYSTLNDLDVSSELGLAACATDLPTVQLYSLYTGKLLEASATYPGSPRCRGDLLSRSYLNPIDCVRFETVVEPYEYGKAAQTSDSRNNTSATTLLVGSSEIIEEWSM